MNRLILAMALVLVHAVMSAQAAGADSRRIAHHSYNEAIAARIRGTWVLSDALTARLGGSTEFAGFTFRPDETVHRPDGKMKAAFENEVIYQTGNAKVEHGKVLPVDANHSGYPYILEEGRDGRLRLLVFGVVEQIEKGNPNLPQLPNTYFSVLYVPAIDPANDLLFFDVTSYVGVRKAGANREVFSVFVRAKE